MSARTAVLTAFGYGHLTDTHMRKIIEDVDGEGLEKLLGQNVVLFCLNYIYAGRLAGVSKEHALLAEAAIVYETGELTAKAWQDAQKLPAQWYVAISAIESFGLSGR